MADSGITITGAREIALKLEALPDRLRERATAHMETAMSRLEAAVRGAMPGDRAASRRTGHLSAGLRHFVSNFPERVVGYVGFPKGVFPNKADYGAIAALEYGAHGRTEVRAHSARLDHIFARFVGPLTVMIAEHSRQVNIAERRFLRDPFAEQLPAIEAEMRLALDEAAAEE